MKIKQTMKAAGVFLVFSVLVLPSVFSIIPASPFTGTALAALNCTGGAQDIPGSSGIAGGKEFCAYGQGVSVKGAKAVGKNFTCPSGSTLIQTTIFLGQQPNYWCATTAVATNGSSGSKPANSPSSAAQTACKGKNGNTYTACVTGYDNPTDTKACDKYTLKDKLTCQTAQKDAAAAATAAGGNDNKQLSCDIAFASPLTWIICPVVDILVTVINGIDGIITNTLNIDVTSIFGPCKPIKGQTTTCDGYHQAWASFRNIALGIMVIAGLIVVIAQAMGTELLDAYTIRKILPRILVAAIAITLSWSIMKFLVQLTDDLGFGIRQLIYAPFVGLKSNINLDILNGGVSGFFGGLGVAGGIFAGGFAAVAVAGGIGIVLSYLATAALAVGVAILVLTIRQVFIIMCVLISPIAIVMYILPNTNRFYKMWWDNFSKALMMFPLIAAMIATGRVFAAVSFAGGGALNGFIAFISYFAPYFMIPLTFKFAGAAMGSIGGAIQSRSQGAAQGLAKYRTGQRQQNRASLKDGTRFKPLKNIPGTTKASGLLNKASVGLGTGINGRLGFGARGKTARGYAAQAAKDNAMKSPGMQAVAGWNDVNRVLAKGMGDERKGRAALVEHLKSGGDTGNEVYSDEEIQAKANSAVTAAKVAGGFTQANGAAAFYNMARDGTAIRDTDDLADLASEVGQGDKNNTFKYAAEGASLSRQAGRPGLAAASEPMGQLAFAKSDQKFGTSLYKSEADGATGKTAATRDMDQLKYATWKSGAGGEVAWTKFGNSKGRDIRNDTTMASDILMKKNDDGTHAYSSDQRQFAAAYLRESEMAIESSTGKKNNRDLARGIINEPARRAAYDSFMNEQVNVGAVDTEGKPEAPRFRKDDIAKEVGDRYASMTPEQRQELIDRQKASGNPDEE